MKENRPMLASLLQRVGLSASGLALTAGLLWQATPIKEQIRERLAKPPTVSALRSTEASRPTGAVKTRVVAEGRIVAYPGAEVILGSEVAGLIVRLNVQEKSVVHKGDLIAELNADDLKASLAEANARVAEADADIRFYSVELRRDEALLARKATTPQNLDTNRRGLETSRAHRGVAIATRDRFEALIAKTQIKAPIDGVVTARHVQPGETIPTSAAIVTIADLNRIRIEAEVDEFDTAGVVLGAPVTFTAEGYEPTTWSGVIEEIPDSVVSRRSRPEDPGRPIDARVLPVKIALRSATPLKLGQRVEVAITPEQEMGPVVH
jgi:multidrug efflux pump subunit AcrA (membrane-fusion protein)